MPDFLGALDDYIGDIGVRRRGGGMRGMRRGGGGGGGFSLMRRGSPSFQAASDRANQVGRMVRPDLAGAPARDAALLPAGFPIFSFALATGTNIITQQMNVLTAFRGQRLVAQVVRSGTSAQTTAPIIQIFSVGMRPVLATGVGVPLEIFAQNAFDTNLLLPPTMPGVTYILGISLSAALTTTDTVTCIVGLLGSAVL
jgi:hypothetical protein